jgi:hypothetical protein
MPRIVDAIPVNAWTKIITVNISARFIELGEMKRLLKEGIIQANTITM